MPSHSEKGFEYAKHSVKFVPRVLTIEQKKHSLSVATDLLQEDETDQNFLEDLFTGGETWVYRYDLETKRKSSQWKALETPRPQKAHLCIPVPVMLFSFYAEGVVH